MEAPNLIRLWNGAAPADRSIVLAAIRSPLPGAKRQRDRCLKQAAAEIAALRVRSVARIARTLHKRMLGLREGLEQREIRDTLEGWCVAALVFGARAIPSVRSIRRLLASA